MAKKKDHGSFGVEEEIPPESRIDGFHKFFCQIGVGQLVQIETQRSKIFTGIISEIKKDRLEMESTTHCQSDGGRMTIFFYQMHMAKHLTVEKVFNFLKKAIDTGEVDEKNL